MNARLLSGRGGGAAVLCGISRPSARSRSRSRPSMATPRGHAGALVGRPPTRLAARRHRQAPGTPARGCRARSPGGLVVGRAPGAADVAAEFGDAWRTCPFTSP